MNQRLPGRPFEYDIQSFPFTPMVLVIGNHSSGKSTFINHLLGVDAQDTGVAPTDDCFTVLERSRRAEVEDGPTLLGCAENRPFKELQNFGRTFSGHLRRKRLVLPADTVMPFGLQIVDTPGMIDMPASEQVDSVSAKSRGYNFVEVVRWWAKRADLILLLFDPDKPGTTGETLEVLTKSLAGLEHKFVILLNKVDRLDNAVDFARAYGTLGWALSKVIPQKDIPQIWTTYSADVPDVCASGGDHSMPLDAFRKKREEVITEVLRAKVRHWDNVITAFEETLRQLEMTVRVIRAVRQHAVRHFLKIWSFGLPALALPGLVATALLESERFGLGLPEWGVLAVWGLYAFVCVVVALFLWDYGQQCSRLQEAQLDSRFQEEYADIFLHTDGEDYDLRWGVVRPKLENLLRAVHSGFALPHFTHYEAARLSECLEEDLTYLRSLAKAVRPPEPTPTSVQPLDPSPQTEPKTEPKSRATKVLEPCSKQPDAAPRKATEPRGADAKSAVEVARGPEEQPSSRREEQPLSRKPAAREKPTAEEQAGSRRSLPRDQKPATEEQSTARRLALWEKPTSEEASFKRLASWEKPAAEEQNIRTLASWEQKPAAESSAPAKEQSTLRRFPSWGQKTPKALDTAHSGGPAGSKPPKDEGGPAKQAAQSVTLEVRRAKSELVQQRLGDLDQELAAARKKADVRRSQTSPEALPLKPVRESEPAPKAARQPPEPTPLSPERPRDPSALAAAETPGSVTGSSVHGSSVRGESSGLEQPRELEVSPVEISCICGYTCGTSKALDRHLVRFKNDSRHAAHFSLV